LFRANLLAPGATDVAVRADPRCDSVFLCLAICADDNGSAGVVFRDFGDELRIFFQRTGLFAVDRKVDQRCACHGACAFRPKLLQLLVDLADLDRKT
jgi:hypothetical protein